MTMSVHGAAAEHCRFARTSFATVPVMFAQVTLEIWNADVSQSPVRLLYDVHWVMTATPCEMFVTVKSRKTAREVSETPLS